MAQYLVLASSKRKQVLETTSNILAAYILCLDSCLSLPQLHTIQRLHHEETSSPLDEGHPLIKIASSF